MTSSRVGWMAAMTLLGLEVPQRVAGQMPPADPADVATLAGILHAWYDVINGPPGAPRQWRRDSTLYTTSATFVDVEVVDGRPKATIFTPEEYRQASNEYLVKEGAFETEIGSRIERFGNLAQVRSVYETRLHTPDDPVSQRGVNYILLYWDGTRWWVTGAVWQDENAASPLPPAWVGSHEQAP